jgi:predicted aminopeptidase
VSGRLPAAPRHETKNQTARRGAHRLAGALVPLALSLSFSACSPAYVLRAGYEEAKILWRRQPIERLLEQPDLDPATRTKLELTLAVRAFAADTLHLRAGKSYATYAQVDDDQVVHVVSAADRFKLQSHTWWFPIVGRVPYKGYFAKADAEAEAAALERDGYDTNVRPSVAFSTLGWFADPLLSTVLRYDRVTLATVIIHELLHTTTYLAGHADFDESLAEFVGHRGAILFFAARGDEPARARAAAAWTDALLFSDFLDGFAARLTQAYAAGVSLDERQTLFAAGQEEFRRLPLQAGRYRDFGTEPLNNAIILQYRMYSQQLRLFDDVFHQHGDDLPRTIAVVLEALRATADDPFRAVRQLLPEPLLNPDVTERSRAKTPRRQEDQAQNARP